MSMEQFYELMEYVMTIAPSVVSILGFIISVIVSIKRQGALNNSQLNAIHSLTNSIQHENAEVLAEQYHTQALLKAVIQENQELKSALKVIMEEKSPIATPKTGGKKDE